MLIWIGAGITAANAPQEQDPAEIRRRSLFGSLSIDPAGAREMTVSEPVEEVRPQSGDGGAGTGTGTGMDAGAPAPSEIIIVVDASAGFDSIVLDGLPGPLGQGQAAAAGANNEYDARAQRVVADLGADPQGEARDRFANRFAVEYFPGHYEPSQRQTVRGALVRAGLSGARADEATTLLH